MSRDVWNQQFRPAMFNKIGVTTMWGAGAFNSPSKGLLAKEHMGLGCIAGAARAAQRIGSVGMTATATRDFDSFRKVAKIAQPTGVMEPGSAAMMRSLSARMERGKMGSMAAAMKPVRAKRPQGIAGVTGQNWNAAVRAHSGVLGMTRVAESAFKVPRVLRGAMGTVFADERGLQKALQSRTKALGMMGSIAATAAAIRARLMPLEKTGLLGPTAGNPFLVKKESQVGFRPFALRSFHLRRNWKN